MKRDATEAVQQSRKIGLAGGAPRSAARDMAIGWNRVVLGPWLQAVAEGGAAEEVMADVDEEEEKAAE
jgi:hypothetical protein